MHIKLGNTYDIYSKAHRYISTVSVLKYNPIDMQYDVYRADYPENIVRISLKGRITRKIKSKKTATHRMFIYLCKIGDNIYKLGISCCPHKRCKQIKTYAPIAKMIFTHVVHNDWFIHERRLLEIFKLNKTKGGNEVLRLNLSDVKKCIQYMKNINTLV